MKTVFFLKINERIKGNGDLPRTLVTEESIREAINLNRINKYEKLQKFQCGDYITCCLNEDSVKPVEDLKPRKGAGFFLGRTFRVTSSLIMSGNSYVVIDDYRQAVFAESIRKATDEEVKEFLRREELSKDLENYRNKMFE